MVCWLNGVVVGWDGGGGVVAGSEARADGIGIAPGAQVCGTFKSIYFDYKSRANNEVPNNPWRIQNTALFPRLDSFLERCHDLLDLCKTVVQFQKLEKIEIGGNKVLLAV